MTGLDLLSGSLRLIGVLAANETPSSTEANNALESLNLMIDSWSNERLLINSIVREVFALVGGQQTYTFGTGGNFNSSRPMLIETALLQIPSTTPVVEIPVGILNKDQYAAETIKTLAATYPRCLYNDDNYPLANINVWPVPSAVCSLVFYSVKPLTTIAALTTTISVPLGYQRALKYNLALELAPEYGKTVSPEVIGIAVSSKADIKRMNSKPSYLRVDDALQAKPAGWNWYTGGTD
ncbi:MAG: hypothetical protein V4568_14665 [Pseudomonadota bacterium]